MSVKKRGAKKMKYLERLNNDDLLDEYYYSRMLHDDLGRASHSDYYINFVEKKLNNVKERFNNANFRSKTSGRIQQIKSVEVIEHGTTVYFWCINMNNFIVYGGSKRGTYNKLNELLMHICFEENKDHINISDFIVR